jgi:hypothetical protein
MEDEQVVHLNNSCADLVSLGQYESFPIHLLAGKSGEWVEVRELCVQVGIDPGDLTEEVVATWLPDPGSDEAYALIIFYEQNSMWTMAAQFNRGRILSIAAAGDQEAAKSFRDP